MAETGTATRRSHLLLCGFCLFCDSDSANIAQVSNSKNSWGPFGGFLFTLNLTKVMCSIRLRSCKRPSGTVRGGFSREIKSPQQNKNRNYMKNICRVLWTVRWISLHDDSGYSQETYKYSSAKLDTGFFFITGLDFYRGMEQSVGIAGVPQGCALTPLLLLC